MKKTKNLKKIIVISAVIVAMIVVAFILKFIFEPHPITEIKFNTVYIGGLYADYPKKNEIRYYIEFKENNKFILMEDDSRGLEENYNEDGDGSCPEMNIDFGTYETKDGNYVLKTRQSARVEFKDTRAVKKEKIYLYANSNLKKIIV